MLWLGSRKGIRPVKTEWWGAGMVICLEQGADLHMAQLMPLPLTVSCFWHKAHCKVTPVQRTLGTFYRPASITKVIWTTIHGSAETLNQKRRTAAMLCDSGISTSIVRRPAAAAAAAASLDTQSTL